MKELFVDFDEFRSEFLLYVLDHEEKTIVPYVHKYFIGLYDVIFELCSKNNIAKIGLYGITGGLNWLYRQLFLSEYYTYDNNDIYYWRMRQEDGVRKYTRPIYYYETKGYNYILKEV